MQLDFDGLGFKLRIPIYNRVNTDLKLRTALIPQNGTSEPFEIEFVEMKLVDSENKEVKALKKDISPSTCIVDDTRKTINAIFHSIKDNGDTEYDLYIVLVDKKALKKFSAHYKFNAGSTIASFEGIDYETSDESCTKPENKKKFDSEEDNTSASANSKIPYSFSYTEIGEPEVTDDHSEDETDRVATKEEQDKALDEAMQLLAVAKSELEDASQSLLDRDIKIKKLEEKILCGDDKKYAEELMALKDENATLMLEKSKLERDYRLLRQRNDNNLKKIETLSKEVEKLKMTPALPVVGSLEKHLNEIVDYMESTAKAAGISLENIHVQTAMKDKKRHVNVYGEIHLLPGRKSLSSSCTIKASLYDAAGNIEIEGSQYISSSFKGFDTFNIGWNGGTDQSWLSETKIRIFVV